MKILILMIIFKKYINKQNSNNKKSILKSYDLYLNNKYEVVI